MKQVYKVFLLFAVGVCCNLLAQVNPQFISTPSGQFPQPPNLSSDTYTRATTKINLLPSNGQTAGFKYGALTAGATKLLNLNLGSYPNYVNNNYTNPANDPNYYTFNPSLVAGVTPGSHQVDNIGGFNYSMPVVCSPGTAGMEPKLAIGYSSNGGDTWLGLGFNLSGISAITRTGKTVLFDGLNSGVKFNSGDVFALDGSRLFLASASPVAYGQSGATYRTEVENYYTITSQGVQGNGPKGFIVTTPDGMTMEYGGVTTAKCVDVDNTEVLAWYLSKVYDVFGNYMTYSYTNTNGELLLDKIEYTGNGNIAPYNKIQFSYVDRSDASTFYVEGKEFKNTHLLNNITCKDINGNAVRKYFFEYQYQNRSLLNKITEVDANGNQLNPTFFEWNDEKLRWNWKFGSITSATDIITATPARLISENKRDLLLARRVNGKLRLDLKEGHNPNGSNAFITPWYITNNGFLLSNDSTIEIYSVYAFDEDDDGFDEVFYIMGHPHIPGSNSYDWEIKKFKLTNHQAGYGNISQEEPLHTVNGSTHHFFGAPWLYQKNVTSGYFYGKQDINGDNLNDVIIAEETGITVRPSNQQAAVFLPISNFVKMSLGDFNGDGVLDIFVSRFVNANINCPTLSGTSITAEVVVYSYNNTTHTLNQIASVPVNGGVSPYMAGWNIPCINYIYANVDKSTGFGDVNGDGKTDVFYVGYNNGTSSCTLNWILSNGLSFMTAQQNIMSLTVPTTLNGQEANFLPNDANNDGKTDVMVSSYDAVNLGHASYSYYTSLGTMLINEGIPILPVWGKVVSAMGDFDCDGVSDFVFQDNATSSYILYHGFGEDRKKVVNRIFNIKDELTIKYEFLPSSGACQKTSFVYNSGTPGFKIIKPHLYAVTTLAANGRTTKYDYTNGILHRQGKGFLGFEEISATDISLSGYYNGSVSKFKYHPVNGGITQNENGITGSNSLTQLNYTYAGNSAFLRALSSSETVSRNYLKSTHTKQTVLYNLNYGGNISSNTTEQLTWGGQPIKTTQVTTLYQALTNAANNSTYYKPQHITEQLSAGGSTSLFEHRNNYDTQGHLDYQVKNENTTQAVTTTYNAPFSAFGAPQSITISGGDIQQRSTQIQSDVTGRFVTKITDAAGHFEEFVYEPGLGNKIQYKDISGLITNYKYDGLGRAIEIKLPNGTTNLATYEWNSYSSPIASNPPYNGTAYGVKITKQAAGAPTSINYYDCNGNMLKVEREGFNGSTEEANYTYNILNQPVTAEDLHYNSQGVYNVTGYTYDGFLRPKTISKSIGNIITYDYNAPSSSGYNKGFVQVSTAAPVANTTYYIKRWNNEAGQVDKVENYSDPQQAHTATYLFNEFGSPKTVSNDFAGSGQYNITMDYDPLGRQNELNDPNAGICKYEYNSIGELMKETTPNGTYTMQYDVLGRLTQKDDGAGTSYTYDYETLQNGRGQIKKIKGPNGITEFKYDAYNRITEEKETVTADNKAFKNSFNYNTYGQVIDHTFPGGFVSTNEYDNIGNLLKIKNNTTVIWQLDNMIAPGMIEKYKYNNGQLSNSINYDGYLNLSGKNYGNLLKEDFTIEPNTGNMQERTFHNSGGSNHDIFVYDEFDRLKQVNYTSGGLQAQRAGFTYNNNGNLENKSDCGDYVYGNTAAPNQLTQIDNLVPNNISLNTLNISYTSFRKVNQISEAASAGTKQFDFVYGNDEQRIKMIYQDAGATSQLQYTRYYAANYDIEEKPNGDSREWSYIYAPTGLCAMYYKTNNTAGELLYVATDHLGSPVMLTDANNAIVEEYSFDAWGRRRNPNDWNDYTVTAAQYMIRGYTMHEMLDEVGIINMNGRVYDPVLGRFLQPDNYVQSPDNLQNFNRYAYCWNNPLKYSDPTGNFTWNDGIALGLIIGGSIMCATGVAAPIGVGLIVSGVAHFGVAFQDYNNNGTSWNQASNSAGININLNFTPNWGNTGSSGPTQAEKEMYENMAPPVVLQQKPIVYNSYNNEDLRLDPNVWDQTMPGYDIDAAVDYLNDHALDNSSGRCAAFVRQALEAGGINTNPHPISAKNYGTYLSNWGFTAIRSTNNLPLRGDIAVIQAYPSGSVHGHIQMFNGTIWVSDFNQKSTFWPGSGYKANKPAYEIYRWGRVNPNN